MDAPGLPRSSQTSWGEKCSHVTHGECSPEPDLGARHLVDADLTLQFLGGCGCAQTWSTDLEQV